MLKDIKTFRSDFFLVLFYKFKLILKLLTNFKDNIMIYHVKLGKKLNDRSPKKSLWIHYPLVVKNNNYF